MATDTPSFRTDGVVRYADGTTTGAAEAVVVTLGFTPRHVKVFNLSDAMVWEKVAGMSAAQTIKTVTAGTTTTDTGSAIVFDENGFTMSATVATTGDALVWYAR